MNSNKKETSHSPSPDVTNVKAKKRAQPNKYTIGIVLLMMWAIISFWGYIAIVHIAIKAEELTNIIYLPASIAYLPFEYKSLVASVALLSIWVPSMWVLKKVLSKIGISKKPKSPLSVPPKSIKSSLPSSHSSFVDLVDQGKPSLHEISSAKSQREQTSPREQTIRYGILATASTLLGLFICIIFVNLAGETTILKIQFPGLLTNPIVELFVIVVAILINIFKGSTIRQFLSKTLSEFWKQK